MDHRLSRCNQLLTEETGPIAVLGAVINDHEQPIRPVTSPLEDRLTDNRNQPLALLPRALGNKLLRPIRKAR